METHGPRRRRSRRRARKKQIVWMVAIALLLGAAVWTHILIQRRDDAKLFQSAASLATAGESPAQKGAVAEPGTSKNLIVFIGHGYGMVPMTATRIYGAGESGELAVDGFTDTALVRTWSHDAQSGDAAAAMTAYMTGQKVDDAVLSESADTRAVDETGRPHVAHGETTCPTAGNGKPVTTLLELAKRAGRSAGVVTTQRVTHALTAATFAHLCHRDGENSIASQLVPGGVDFNAQLGEGVDVILGGGWQHFLPKEDPRGSTRSDTRDLFAEMRAKGYAVITREAELAADLQPAGKVLGLFNRDALNYDADRTGTGEPSLTEMTTRAIDLLQRNANGYLLVVAGARIGDAFEASLVRNGLQDALAFDQAVGAALNKVRMFDPDLRNTTLVVLADHDATLIMNGNAALTGRTTGGHPGIVGLLHSYDDPAQSAQDASGHPFGNLVFGAGTYRIKGPRSQGPLLNELAVADRNYRSESAVEATGATGGTDVPLSAIGAAAPTFRGTLDNTQVYTLLRGAMGL